MRANMKHILLLSLFALLVIGGTWSWFTYMEKYWEARPRISEEAKKNPMLAANRFLTGHGYKVAINHSLNDALINTPPNGALLIAENKGIMTPAQFKKIMHWVEAGNTLITIPKQLSSKLRTPEKEDKSLPKNDAESDSEDVDEDEEEVAVDEKAVAAKPLVPLIETDPVSAYLGVALADDAEWNQQSKKEKTDSKPDATVEQGKLETAKENVIFPVSDIFFPNASYALQVWRGGRILESTKHQSVPFFSDVQNKAMRVYSQGKGHIVMIDNNYFSNDNLEYFDHAELLLALTHLNRGAQHFIIVQHLNMPSWVEMLWSSFKLAIISIACVLLLLTWRAIRRFGPLLPEPNSERRSLIEHIDASGRWLWKVPGGKEILLNAARNSTRQMLQRRAPELQNLPFLEQIERMALHNNVENKLEKSALIKAWQEPAAKLPMAFFHQIQTLQQLRKHYER